VNVLIQSIDVMIGGDDTLNGGAGNDILIGGQGNDLLYGTLSEDLLFGSNVSITLSGGIVVAIEADMHDLVTEALFGSFNALPREGDVTIFTQPHGLPGHQAIVPGQPGGFVRPDPLHDARLFEWTFDLTEPSQLLEPGATATFDETFDLDSATAGSGPTHGVLQQGRGDGAPGGAGDSPRRTPDEQGRTDEPPAAPLQPRRLALDTEPADAGETQSTADEREGDLLAAGLGAAGLLAVQRPHERCKRVRDDRINPA
jgi:hypothetical protein